MFAFKRMYVDIPTDTADKLKTLAADRGMSQKALLASLIDSEVTKESETKKTTKRRSKKRG